jgi:hypothetical protein
MYTYIYLQIHICIYIYIFIYKCTYIYMYIWNIPKLYCIFPSNLEIFWPASSSTWIHIYIYMCMYIFVHIYIYIYVCSYSKNGIDIGQKIRSTWSKEVQPEGLINWVKTLLQVKGKATFSTSLIRLTWQEAASAT